MGNPLDNYKSPATKKMTTDSPFVPKQHPVRYKTIRVNELDIFYREVGPQDAPVILLLHGFPTSSNMFRNLIPQLATSLHVVAPDYPGFGQSSMPSHNDFDYSFENLTNVVEALVDRLGLTKYSIYVMDYGAPIGYRLALRHPERVQALINDGVFVTSPPNGYSLTPVLGRRVRICRWVI